MAAKKQQTHAKRARELAVKERRERKRAKKAALREAGGAPPVDGVDGLTVDGLTGVEGQDETTASEWIR